MTKELASTIAPSYIVSKINTTVWNAQDMWEVGSTFSARHFVRDAWFIR